MNTVYYEIHEQQLHTQICKFISINSVASYMFRPPIVVIFREAFFEGYIT